ncbi:MAG: EcsC family protein, partial [Proteobacteria bacterium]|nr:EcsC family protein [Pseudomonadota bacterium]
MSTSRISKQEQDFINQSVEFLEHPGFAIRLMNKFGKPLESLQNNLPLRTQQTLSKIVHRSLQKALHAGIRSIRTGHFKNADWQLSLEHSKKTSWAHTASVAATGAAGGLFGLLAFPVEMPLTTSLILRAISSIADDWGHDIEDPSIQMQCLYIFSLGSPRHSQDNALESSYFSSRIAFEQLIQAAANSLASQSGRELAKGYEKLTAPAVLKLLNKIAGFFELTVTEKLLAESIPLIGAIGGASINAFFCSYFTEAARFHFGLLRLEALHGPAAIQAAFELSRHP